MFSQLTDCGPLLSSRQLIFCALAVLAGERKPIECLDAFGATGKVHFFHILGNIQ